MTLFNHAWSTVSHITFCKCWLKSQFLGVQHIAFLNFVIRSLAPNDDIEIDLTVTNIAAYTVTGQIVDPQALQSIHNSLSSNLFIADEPRIPLHEILYEVLEIEAQSQLMLILNSPAPSDRQKPRDEIDNDAIFQLYKNSVGVSDSSNAGPNNVCNEVPTAVHASNNAVSLSQLASKTQGITSDGPILELLNHVSRRATEIEGQDIAY